MRMLIRNESSFLTFASWLEWSLNKIYSRGKNTRTCKYMKVIHWACWLCKWKCPEIDTWSQSLYVKKTSCNEGFYSQMTFEIKRFDGNFTARPSIQSVLCTKKEIFTQSSMFISDKNNILLRGFRVIYC